MPRLSFRRRLLHPAAAGRRMRRAAYVLPTLFTAGNLLLGWTAVLRTFRGAMLASTGAGGAEEHFAVAAVAIGLAAFLDGLDGRIARLTNTSSEFGREMDSLADVISFGLAPALLAFAWGVQFIDPALNPAAREHILRAGYFFAFLFLLSGAVRLARFNISKNPVPKNPGRPDRKYFVGLPIPASAATVAAVVYAAGAHPVRFWPATLGWLAMLGLLSFLMVSTWRYQSFKDISLLRPRSPVTAILLGGLIYLIWNWPQPVLLAMAIAYVSSGIIVRVGGVARRRFRQARSPKHPGTVEPERQIG
ncbi:MAG: phosphatidylcholine/phosphatidylserine synthase [Acidobacteria bacterium]|nr:phosphatidylcholine/phosphatidylserine synthase [Acidobacteriota bacterium]